MRTLTAVSRHSWKEMAFSVLGAIYIAGLPVLNYFADNFDSLTFDYLAHFTVCILVAIVSLTLLINKGRQEITLFPADLFAVLLALYMFISGYLHGNAPVVYTKPLVFLVFYIAVRLLCDKTQSWSVIKDSLYGGLVLYLTFLLFLWLRTGSPAAFVNGTFKNPNLNAGFICMMLPVAFGYVRRRWRFDTVLAIVICLMLVALIVMSRSRTAWLATIIMGLVYLHRQQVLSKFVARHKLLTGTILFCLLTVLAGSLYYLKPASVRGRLFIYKTSVKMLAERPVFGIGYAKYQARYNDFQAEYLKENADEPLKYLADNNYSPFNELLGIAIELGAIGFLLSGMLLLCVLLPCVRYAKAHRNLPWQCYVLLAVFVCAIFNYPLSSTVVCILTILAGASLLTYLRDYSPRSIVLAGRYRVIFFAFYLTIILGIFIHGYTLFKVHRACRSWREGMRYSLENKSETAKIAYENAKIWLGKDGRFLYNYGAELCLSGAYKESIEVLNNARNYYTSSNLYLFLGDAYIETGQYRLAEKAYLHAACMVPAQVYPKYKLMKLYLATDQKELVLKVACQINSTPVKVPSRIVREVHIEARKFIDSLCMLKK